MSREARFIGIARLRRNNAVPRDRVYVRNIKRTSLGRILRLFLSRSGPLSNIRIHDRLADDDCTIADARNKRARLCFGNMHCRSFKLMSYKNNTLQYNAFVTFYLQGE